MRCVPLAAIGIAAGVLMAAAVHAQVPGGMPGMPVQRLAPSQGQGADIGTPGAPMARMGRGGGMPQGSAPSRRSYGGMGGVPGRMSSQQFRSSNYAGQARNLGGVRSAAGIVSGATQGAVSVPANPR